MHNFFSTLLHAIFEETSQFLFPSATYSSLSMNRNIYKINYKLQSFFSIHIHGTRDLNTACLLKGDQLTEKGSNFHFLFIWLELFTNMFSVIIWKQNFEKLNRTGAIAPLPSDRTHYLPSTITISALTSKLLRNSKFSQHHRVFLSSSIK